MTRFVLILKLIAIALSLSGGETCAQTRRAPPHHPPRIGGVAWSDTIPTITAAFEQPAAVVASAFGSEASAPETTLDLDEYIVVHDEYRSEPAWDWQLFPSGLVYRPYLASRKEPRLASYLISSRDDTTLWEGMMGAQVGVFRFGNRDPYYPEGYQLDVEAAADIRLDIPNNVDVRSTDFRVGLPFSYGVGRHRIRFGYYHLSSHLGDEFLLANPDFERLNYSRDALMLGGTYFLTDKTRIYGEVGWAFHSDVSEPWEFEFGLDHAPYLPTGLRGDFFWGVHGHLREEVRFGGNVSAQVGWAWVGESGRRFRCGLQFYDGKSNQYSFFNEHEQHFGIGIWYDL